jgi:hypothetical protein
MVARGSSGAKQHWLPHSMSALEVGDWRTALRLGGWAFVNGEGPEIPMLAVTLRTTAAAMRDQAAGDLAATTRQLSDAAGMLPPRLRRLSPDAQLLASLTPEPLGTSPTGPAFWAWRVARVIWREQWLIADLRDELVRFPSPRDHLIEAYIQFMFEVEFSPYSWYRPPQKTWPYPAVTPARDDLCRRASNLRKLVEPTHGDVSQSVWQDIGRHCGLRAAAQERLAERPLLPEMDRIAAWSDLPVRRGRQRAWEHARQWVSDLDYFAESA